MAIDRARVRRSNTLQSSKPTVSANRPAISPKQKSEKSVQVVDFSAVPMGASFRRQRPGPETDLVDWFLSELPVRLPPRCHATIFREPRLASGFPDLVIAIWHETRTTQWAAARGNVNASDLRLMHYLVERGTAEREELAAVFGRTASSSLRRLSEADMVRQIRNCWQPRALSASFAIRNLIAIEAKMTQWPDALRQAFTNTWFASSSCILLPRVPTRSDLFQEAALLGVEVWVKDRAPFDWRALPPEPRPRSYASWLFNEWVWRVASTGVGTDLNA